MRYGVCEFGGCDERAIFEGWLFRSPSEYSDRALPIDVEIAGEWARLNVPHPLPVIDGLIAATAKVRGLMLVTRNVQHVEPTGAQIFDPFRA